VIARLTRATWLGIGAALLVLPALPLPTWSRAPDAGPIWTPQVEAWGIGLAVVLAIALMAGRAAHWMPGLALARPRLPDNALPAAAALLVAGGAAYVMQHLFAGNPHLVDEMAQLLHARAFAHGRLAAPAPEPPAAFLITHTWITPAGWVSQYPPGQTALLAVGLLLKAEWLVNPVLGGVSTLLVYRVAKGLYGRATALAAALLWALSAWVLFMSGTYLNHVGAVSFALVAWAAVLGSHQHRSWHWLLAGGALAATAATRPLDGVAAALPILLWIAGSRRRLAPVTWMAAGGLPIIGAWAYLNWRLYGHPLTLGYTALYGSQHSLGFHSDPWGQPFSPAIALSNLAVGIRRLHLYLYEWPIPALLPVAAWAIVGRPQRFRDLVLAVGMIAVPALYFFYWHSGFYLGPRFYYTAAPFLVIATARAWRTAWLWARRHRSGPLRADAALAAAGIAVVLWGTLGVLPSRWEAYREGLATLKLHPERELAARGVRRALVLVPESFGSRTIVRLWALGVPPGSVERAYRRLDTCDLYRFARAAEAAAWPASETTARLEHLEQAAGDPPPLLKTWPDPTIRLRPGSTPPEECQIELRRDLAGFTLFGYLAWRNPIGLSDGVVFARDLFEQNPALLARYPGWEVWRFAPPADRPNSPPVLARLGTLPEQP
jgi:4-amino-4-deoxy-L-arabinose transferase-like glycosyltransferase